jgi:4-hydroxybenzoate polyprenyltransferase
MKQLRGWAQAAHPFPIVAVLSLTALVGLASTHDGLDEGRFALMLAAMLLSQLAIGWLNDYRDREHDRVYQPGKPIPAGRLDPRPLPFASALAAAGALASGVPLGPLPLLFLVIGTGAGLAYDFGLKDTRWSPLPFVAAMAVLPAFVWTSLDIFRVEFLWLYLIASPLALAAQVANALPDIETDAAAGRRSIAVVLGIRKANSLVALCLAATQLLTVLSLLWLDYGGWAVPLVIVPVPGLIRASASRNRFSRGDLVWNFRLVAVTSVIFAAGWLAAV